MSKRKKSKRDCLTERIDLERQIQDERYKHLQRLARERWKQQRELDKMRAGALSLQAVEYTRRFEHLNGEQARTKEILTTYVPREIYESRHRELEAELRPLQEQRVLIAAMVGDITNLQTASAQDKEFQANWKGRMALTGFVAAVISAIVTALVVHYLTK